MYYIGKWQMNQRIENFGKEQVFKDAMDILTRPDAAFLSYLSINKKPWRAQRYFFADVDYDNADFAEMKQTFQLAKLGIEDDMIAIFKRGRGGKRLGWLDHHPLYEDLEAVLKAGKTPNILLHAFPKCVIWGAAVKSIENYQTRQHIHSIDTNLLQKLKIMQVIEKRRY